MCLVRKVSIMNVTHGVWGGVRHVAWGGAQKLFLNGMCCRLIDYLICTSVPRVVRDYSYN